MAGIVVSEPWSRHWAARAGAPRLRSAVVDSGFACWSESVSYLVSLFFCVCSFVVRTTWLACSTIHSLQPSMMSSLLFRRHVFSADRGTSSVIHCEAFRTSSSNIIVFASMPKETLGDGVAAARSSLTDSSPYRALTLLEVVQVGLLWRWLCQKVGASDEDAPSCPGATVRWCRGCSHAAAFGTRHKVSTVLDQTDEAEGPELTFDVHERCESMELTAATAVVGELSAFKLMSLESRRSHSDETIMALSAVNATTHMHSAVLDVF